MNQKKYGLEENKRRFFHARDRNKTAAPRLINGRNVTMLEHLRIS